MPRKNGYVERYVEHVRDALNNDRAQALSKADYIEALEELATDIDGMIEAAREELRAEEKNT